MIRGGSRAENQTGEGGHGGDQLQLLAPADDAACLGEALSEGEVCLMPAAVTSGRSMGWSTTGMWFSSVIGMWS